MLKCLLTNSRLTRRILAIQKYSFTIKYCKGSDIMYTGIPTMKDMIFHYVSYVILFYNFST